MDGIERYVAFVQAALTGLLASESGDFHYNGNRGKGLTREAQVACAAFDMADAMQLEYHARMNRADD